jgi:putative hydrolase of the HAD superfamily
MTATFRFQLIAFDADDTLWVFEPFYRKAEERLTELLSPYVDERLLRRSLYERELGNLPVFGYGAKGFTLSMIETAIELSGNRIRGEEIQRIVDLGRSLMQKPISLLPGARETVEAMSSSRELMIITKGDLVDQERKLARSGLTHAFRHVEIVSDKNEATYLRILEKHGVDPSRFLMVGNSLRSDILPVVRLGGSAVHIPAEITWDHENQVPEAEKGNGYFELENIAELPALLAQLEAITPA